MTDDDVISCRTKIPLGSEQTHEGGKRVGIPVSEIQSDAGGPFVSFTSL